ncbi:MAG: 5-(carboxyamino)imidazole ribonucleotide mutase [Verrucomicrobiales bacterium]|nr:5-(carboxyamino)imidazole ribonucleotide mutase [Verrucomicrobiales bacterium]
MTKQTSASAKPVVGIIMGSLSDWETMRHVADRLDQFGIPYEKKIISAHRAPHELIKYASTAADRGLKIIIAGAGGAAHLAGVTAAVTQLPVLGIPMESALQGVDSLLSIVQMPAGVPVATFAIGKAGAVNAALSAVSILALADKTLAKKLTAFRKQQTDTVLSAKLLE